MIPMPKSLCAAGRRCRVAFALLPLAGGLALLPVAPGYAARPQDGEVYNIQRVFKANATDRYKMAMKLLIKSPMTGDQEIEVTISMKMKETIKEVKDDGAATAVLELYGAQLKAGDLFEQEIPDDQMPKVTQTIDKTGKVTETKVEGGGGPFAGNGGVMQALARIRTPFYPPKGVKIGESWDFDMNDAKGPNNTEANVKGKATLVGKETVAGAEALKIKYTVEAASTAKDKPDDKLTLDGVSHIEIKTGKLVQIRGKLEGNLGPAGKTKADIIYDRLTDDGKEKKEEKK